MTYDSHALNGHSHAAPSKPRAHMTHTDRAPMVYRPGALDASLLPSRTGNTLTYPDGRKDHIK